MSETRNLNEEWADQILSRRAPTLSAHPYGDGLLVWLPWAYNDGDMMCVLVESHPDGFRVSDRAMSNDFEEIVETGPNLLLLLATVGRRAEQAQDR